MVAKEEASQLTDTILSSNIKGKNCSNSNNEKSVISTLKSRWMMGAEQKSNLPEQPKPGN